MMEMVTLPRTGLTLSTLGMGTVPIAAGRVPPDSRVPTLRAVYDLGINWFDTARNCEEAEDALGEAFFCMRDRVVIMSKSSATERAALQSQIDETLRRLKSDYVDVYMLHAAWARQQECFLGASGLLEIAQRAKEAGKIRFLVFLHTRPNCRSRLSMSNSLTLRLCPPTLSARNTSKAPL